MLVMVVFFIAFRWIHLSTPLIRLFLLRLILLLMPTLNFLPVWFALSLLRFFFFQAEDGIRVLYVTGVQTCALPISGDGIDPELRRARVGRLAGEDQLLGAEALQRDQARSEERHVGKECRSGRASDD